MRRSQKTGRGTSCGPCTYAITEGGRARVTCSLVERRGITPLASCGECQDSSGSRLRRSSAEQGNSGASEAPNYAGLACMMHSKGTVNAESAIKIRGSTDGGVGSKLSCIHIF